MATICIIGMWHLGCVTAACLARRHKVVCTDLDSSLISGIQGGSLPIMEAGLDLLVKEGVNGGRISFNPDVAGAASSSDAIYIAFDTPVDENDGIDLTPIEKSFDLIIPTLKNGQPIIISSQVPVGTSRRLLAKANAAGKNPIICYSPENLRLGSAIETFSSPERIVLGLSDASAAPAAEDIFSGVSGKRLFMDLESAEMSKHAMNAYLATMISLSGEICNLCEITGADATAVAGALLSEKRVSPLAPLSPGLGFGGGTLARDVQVLRGIGAKGGISTHVLDGAYLTNHERMGYVRARLSKILGGLGGKKIAFFGLTYKAGTNTLRRSLAVDVIDGMAKDGCEIRAFDPSINQIPGKLGVKVCASALEAASGADAIVITTAWEEFKSLDYKEICKSMRRPVLLDARNMLQKESLAQFIEYYGVGIGHAKQ